MKRKKMFKNIQVKIDKKEENMKLKVKSVLMSLLFYCALISGPVLAAQGTDGTELKAVEAQTLTIRLGPEWAGVQFHLKTDVGVYPGTVAVGEDGVLRMEIGGSDVYELSILEDTIPVHEENQAEPQTETAQAEAETAADETEESPGIPALHIALFIGSMLFALGVLIYAHVSKSQREAGCEEDDDVI